MAPKDIARSYPKRGLTADVGFRSEPKFCGDGSIELNGSNQYLNAELSSALGDSFTIMAWAKRLKGSSYQYIFDTGDRTVSGGEISLAIDTSNNLYFYDGSGSLTATTFNTDLATWYHVAIAVAPGSGNLKIYADGIDVTPTHSANINITDPTFEIGRHMGSANYLGGHVSDVRIYDETLTQDQIRELLNNPGQTVPTGLTSADLIHRYLLETDTNDSGATGDNLTANGSPSFTVDRPQLPRGLDLARGAAMARVYTGRAVDFDGSADYLDIGQKDFGTGDFSISLWFYDQVSSGGNRSLYSKGTYNTVGGLLIYNVYGATGPGEYLMLRNDHQASGGLYDDRLIITTEPTPNTWHHIAVTRTGGTVKGYFDGKLVNTSTNFNPAWDINVTQNSFIGARDPSSPGSFWDGFISSVKVWDTVLTDAQVAEQFHNPEQVLPTGTSASNLDRYYPLSDYNDTGGTGGRYFQDMGADGEPAEDQGSSSMAFAQPVPCPQLGLQQSATRLYYDGTSGTTYNVEVTGHSLNLPSFSIAFWGFFQSNNPNTTSCCFDTSGGGTFQYFINSTAGNLTVYNGAPTATFNGAVPRDEWVHVVITGHDSSPYIKCYVNGAEKTINSGSAATVGLVATNYYLFSRSANTLSHTGFGDNYSIYDSNLGASEALELYNQGIGYDPRTNVGNYTSASSLIRLYKFDDLTTVKDYSGNNAHADVNGTFKAASFPENASGSTLVGDFSMKRKGVSVLNPTTTPNVSFVQSAIISNDGSLTPDPSKSGYSFSAFIRFQQSSGATWYPVVFGATNYNTASQRFILIFNTSVASLRMTMSDGSTPRDYYWPSGLSDPEEWHQLAFTIDYTTSPNTTFKLYLDGALVSTQATHVHSAFDPGDILVGSYTYSNGNFPGAIACFKMYQTKLSDNEIEQIYNSDLRLIKGLNNE